MQIVDVPVSCQAPKTICFDEEWLAILRETHDLMHLRRGPTKFPTPFHAAPAAAAEHRTAVTDALRRRFGDHQQNECPAPQAGFAQTVDASKRGQGTPPQGVPRNPQTEAVLQLLGRPWNLGGDSQTPQPHVLPLRGDDLLVDANDGHGQHGGEANPMFDAVPINNFNPFAYADAKDAAASTSAAGRGGFQSSGKRPKLSAVLEQASGGADAGAREHAAGDVRSEGGLATAHNPEEVDIGSSDDEK